MNIPSDKFSLIMDLFSHFFSAFQFYGRDEKMYFNDKVCWATANNGELIFPFKELEEMSFSLKKEYIGKLSSISNKDVSVKSVPTGVMFKIGGVSIRLAKDAALDTVDQPLSYPSDESVVIFTDEVRAAIADLKFLLSGGEGLSDVGGIYFGEGYAYATDKSRVMRVKVDCEGLCGNVLSSNLVNFIISCDESLIGVSFEETLVYLIYESFVISSSIAETRLPEIERAFSALVPESEEIATVEGDCKEDFANFIALASADKSGRFGYSVVEVGEGENLVKVSKSLSGGVIDVSISVSGFDPDTKIKINERFFYDGVKRFDRFVVTDRCVYFRDDRCEYAVMLMR